MANLPMTHEERLAREIHRCRALCRELGFESTAHYLDIASSKLHDERVERSRRVDSGRAK